MKIAVDAMGGDSAPDEVVKGAVEAVKDSDELSIILVGDQPRISDILDSLDYDGERIETEHTTEEIAMDEDAVESIRKKEKASINICSNLLKEQRADAILSAGNTGATVSATTLNVGLLEGIDRPGIAVPFPNEDGYTLLVDVGANIYCKPEHLLQYGIMAEVYQKVIGEIDDPVIGLLNIGEEKGKGNQLMRETLPLFEKSPLNFGGNCEGQGIFSGEFDVVVTEGFLGNVLLKTMEGFSSTLIDLINQELQKKIGDGSDSEILSGLFNKIIPTIKRRLDYTEYGGAPLLGLNGVCIICHGRSGQKAIRNAIQVAGRFYRLQINEKIVKEVKKVQEEMETIKSG